MLKLLLGLLIAGTIGLFSQAAIAQTTDFRSTGFQEIDSQNGVVTDSRGFRSSWVSTGSTVYQQPVVYGGFGYPVAPPLGRPKLRPPIGVRPVGVRPVGVVPVGVGPGVVRLPHRHPRLIIAPVVRSPGIVIAPTFQFGGNTTCTTTNTITSSDGTVFRSTTTQPCGF